MPGNADTCTEQDLRFMSLAVHLADSVKGATFPNPAVGAVIVKKGNIVGKGATSHCGGPHAEINALAAAKEKARGATMYVTLEPCCHFGKTPPCTAAIIGAGIKRVCVSTKDPNPLVNGKGSGILKKNGIEVVTGLMAHEAERINEDFFFWITQKSPWVSLKLAMTLDGRIADAAGASQWITSKDSRRYGHYLRARNAAVGVGRGTLIKDNPKLTVRHGKGSDPVRFVFSSKASVPSNSYFVTIAKRRPRSILVVAGGDAGSKERRENGVEVWRTGTIDREKNLRSFLRMAGSEGISSILIEGGSALASSFIENRLVNRLYLFYGNKILGGGLPGLAFSRRLALDKSMTLGRIEIKRLGGDVMVTGLLARR
ncbi:MAG TPA: bifunctional diaminohydroxyphosphoribosylaminopyrimidine deaminase/5-amino-6-(5-phosphoribosylamino)uracil reductase RibD [Chitinivibrionales bacterium]|nr:bifunctional diaminohydroxyphosphoribosylaminopyrimidine deaminase/5-amino-6-(5-phosphoribosylamino)uracil reductase RibD [Chitinivibrionales bacterium]